MTGAWVIYEQRPPFKPRFLARLFVVNGKTGEIVPTKRTRGSLDLDSLRQWLCETHEQITEGGGENLVGCRIVETWIPRPDSPDAKRR